MSKRGEYIIRIDADDICQPMRFQRQIEMDASNARTFGAYDKLYKSKILQDINVELLFKNPIVHPTVVIRK